MSYPDGAQAFGHDCWNCRLVCRSRERYCRVDPVGFERRFGECGFGTHGFMDPFDLRRVDIVPAPSGKETGSVGRHPDRFD